MMKFFALAVLLACSTSFADRVESLGPGENTTQGIQRQRDILGDCIQKVSKDTPMKLEPWTDNNVVIQKLKACTGNPALHANDLLRDKIVASAPTSKTRTAGLCYGKNPDFSPSKGGTGGKFRLLLGFLTKDDCLSGGGVRWL